MGRVGEWPDSYTAIRLSQFNFLLLGNYLHINGQAGEASGGYGRYSTSKSSEINTVYNFEFGVTGIRLRENLERGRGFSLRCLAH